MRGNRPVNPSTGTSLLLQLELFTLSIPTLLMPKLVAFRLVAKRSYIFEVPADAVAWTVRAESRKRKSTLN
jgi:hypothetical protein